MVGIVHQPDRRQQRFRVLGIPLLTDEDLSELSMDCGFLGREEIERRVVVISKEGKIPPLRTTGRHIRAAVVRR